MNILLSDFISLTFWCRNSFSALSAPGLLAGQYTAHWLYQVDAHFQLRKYGSNSIYSAEERVPSASEMYNKVSGAWLAQSEEHVTLDLGMVSLSPKSGVEIT